MQSNSDVLPVALSRSAKIRKVILFGLLFVMMIALLYDYRVARPAVANDYDRITDESRRLNGIAGETFSNEDLRTLLGKTPSEEFTDGSDLVEVYSYRGGIPGRPHRLFAIFKANGDQKLFYRHSKFVFETRGDVAPIADPVILQFTEDEAALLDEQYEQSDGMGGGPEAAQEGQRSRRDPAAMFAERDADADGKLTGDEIPAPMAERLSDIDTDGDGSVTKSEMDASLAKIRERTGGGGDRSEGRPEPSDEEASGRPEAEE
ncbi:MAG: hypothetical protein WBD20_24705 [Pirellulaceae bacterium]